MTSTLDEVRLGTPAEAAEALAISVRQLDRLVRAGVIKPVRLTANGNRRFRVADLAALASTTKEDD
jgi:DNA-binding transcriptional MerR regulator